MSDVKVNVMGERAMVSRAWRKDAPEMLEASEYVTVTRTTDGQVLSVIRPEMLAFAIPHNAEDQPIATFLADPASLTLVYVLEFVTPLHNGQAGEPWPSGSDRAEALVLRVRDAHKLLTPEWQEQLSLQPDDLIVGDNPHYISIDSLLAPVPAVVGARDPTGARRCLACLAPGANLRLRKFTSLIPLAPNDPVLKANDDIAHLLPARPSSTIDKALLTAAAEAATPPVDARQKRDIEDISDDSDVIGFANDAASPVPKKSNVETVATVVAPPPPAAAAPVSTRPLIVVLPEVVARWADHKAALTHALLERMTHESAEEKLLDTSAAWRQVCLRLELSHELGAFVEETALAAEDQLVAFLARFPLSLEHLALPFLRVIVYLALSDLVQQPGRFAAALRERVNKRRLEEQLKN